MYILGQSLSPLAEFGFEKSDDRTVWDYGTQTKHSTAENTVSARSNQLQLPSNYLFVGATGSVIDLIVLVHAMYAIVPLILGQDNAVQANARAERPSVRAEAIAHLVVVQLLSAAV